MHVLEPAKVAGGQAKMQIVSTTFYRGNREYIFKIPGVFLRFDID